LLGFVAWVGEVQVVKNAVGFASKVLELNTQLEFTPTILRNTERRLLDS
jgi:hypothetical protein